MIVDHLFYAYARYTHFIRQVYAGVNMKDKRETSIVLAFAMLSCHIWTLLVVFEFHFQIHFGVLDFLSMDDSSNRLLMVWPFALLWACALVVINIAVNKRFSCLIQDKRRRAVLKLVVEDSLPRHYSFFYIIGTVVSVIAVAITHLYMCLGVYIKCG